MNYRTWLCALGFLLIGAVQARPTEIILGYGAGGPTDVLVRAMVSHLNEIEPTLNLLIVNKPGASSNIGYRYFIAEPKGILLAANPTIITNGQTSPQTYPREITVVAQPLFVIGKASLALIVSRKVSSLNELKAMSKVQEIKFGEAGVGTEGYFGMKKLCQSFRCLDVPYKTGADMHRDLSAGVIDAYVMPAYGLQIVQSSPLTHEVHRFHETWIMLFDNGRVEPSIRAALRVALEKLPESFYDQYNLNRFKGTPQQFWDHELRKRP